MVKRIVIAAPASGSGKTTVTLGIMAALKRRGLSVAPFKVGPDFIDPGYHGLATGTVSVNLDGWICGPRFVRVTFARHAAGKDIAIVEGVMGLFDGIDGVSEAGSTAEMAKLLAAPVVLVVDARSQARSVAALVHGFASFDPRLNLAGVILNNVASANHERVLRDALAAALPAVTVLGCMPKDPALAIPSRHLGLCTVEDNPLPEEILSHLADVVEEHLDLDRLLRLQPLSAKRTPCTFSANKITSIKSEGRRRVYAFSEGGAVRRNYRRQSPLPASPLREEGRLVAAASPGRAQHPPALPLKGQEPSHLSLAGQQPRPLPIKGRDRVGMGVPSGDGAPLREADPVRIAVARDAAFCFVYQDNLRLLEEQGAELRYFSPLHDPLPEGISGIYLPGGYPELFAATLAANGSLMAAIRQGVEAGMPVYAECGGFIYLSRAVEADGVVHPLVGIFPVQTRMLPRRKALGYREVELSEGGIIGSKGSRARGHEFHYSEMEEMPETVERLYRVTRKGIPVGAEGFRYKNCLASYIHLHFGSSPHIAASFVRHCGAFKTGSLT